MRRRTAHRFERVVETAMTGTGDKDTFIRMSSVARRFRERGLDSAADALELEAKEVAPFCPRCERKIEDPVIGIIGTGKDSRAGYACPWCSDPSILARWEEEGRAAIVALVKPS